MCGSRSIFGISKKERRSKKDKKIGYRIKSKDKGRSLTMYVCPYCEEELTVHDYYGEGNIFSSDFKKTGYIYQCNNEECKEFQTNYHTDAQGSLHEGYPR